MCVNIVPSGNAWSSTEVQVFLMPVFKGSFTFSTSQPLKNSVMMRTQVEPLLYPEACHQPLKCRTGSYLPNSCCWHLCILISWDHRMKKQDAAF